MFHFGCLFLLCYGLGLLKGVERIEKRQFSDNDVNFTPSELKNKLNLIHEHLPNVVSHYSAPMVLLISPTGQLFSKELITIFSGLLEISEKELSNPGVVYLLNSLFSPVDFKSIIYVSQVNDPTRSGFAGDVEISYKLKNNSISLLRERNEDISNKTLS